MIPKPCINLKPRALFCIIFIVFGILNASAETFIVTNRNDSGPGSLREALTLAANNGYAETDHITFSLPGNTIADRTITILSSLPQINTPLIIDASSQPGDLLSANGAKVIIEAQAPFTDAGGSVLSRSDCFFVTSGADVFELYGLIIRNFKSYETNGSLSSGDAVFADVAATRLVIGAPGKGNVFYNNGGAIEAQGVRNYIIQSNLIGIKEDGIQFGEKIQIAIALTPEKDCLIGGDNPAEGNVGFGDFDFGNIYSGINLAIKNNIFNANPNYQRTAAAEALIKDNHFHVSIFANLPPAAPDISEIDVSGNVFGCGLQILKCGGVDVQISGNHFGTSANQSSTLPIYDAAINISQTTGTVFIGGGDDQHGNVFTGGTATAGVKATIQAAGSSKIELSHNSFFCNGYPAFSYIDKGAGDKPLDAQITSVTSNSVNGQTKAGARVELFYTDVECTGCEPKTFLASVTADNTGQWKYTGSIKPGFGVLAGATLDHTSSEFTNIVIYTDQVSVKNAGCSAGGSISGVTIVNGGDFKWVNDAGVTVGYQPDLHGVPAGRYRLLVQQAFCTTYSPYFEIDNAPELTIANGSEKLINEQCGGKNGSIQGLAVDGGTPPYTYTWSANGNEIPNTSLSLSDIAAGTYKLTVTDAGGCTVNSEYNVQNETINITPPVTNEFTNCNGTAVIEVQHPASGYIYRLYDVADGGLPVQENSTGKFYLPPKSKNPYYVVQAIGACESSRSAGLINAITAGQLIIPNTITPNGDGINDTWAIAGLENFPAAMVQVFNRYGTKVFESIGAAHLFDGNSNGQPLPTGVYYFVIDLSKGCDLLSGNLTILR